MRRLLALLLLSGCAPPPAEPPVVAEHLPLPDDLADVDWAAAFSEGFSQLLAIDAASAWAGHAASLQARQPGCPDLWASPPPQAEDLDTSDGALGWADLCRADDLDWTGFLFWDGEMDGSGDLDSAEGRTIVGSRRLAGDGLVSEVASEQPRFGFEGEAEDAFTLTEATGYTAWSRSSFVAGSAYGSAAAPLGGSLVPAWRAELYLFLAVGDSMSFEARGQAYLPDTWIQGRFDSLAADLQYGDADPDGCSLEPRGWLGLRDSSAYWYELVFQPRPDDVTEDPLPNAPLDVCDGCGTLYARGLEQGTVCLDVEPLIAALVSPPTPADYLLTLRDLTTPED